MIKIRKFYAPWCAPCKVLAPILDEVANEAGIEVESIDASAITSNELSEYGIHGVPTLQLIENDTVLKTVVGGQTKDQLREFITNVE